MTFKLISYGCRPNEVPFFHQLNKYHYELVLVEELLDAHNASKAKGCDAVLLRGNCLANRDNLALFAQYGIKYVFTRTVGYNHIDLQAAADFDIQVARVPSYSPNAISELAVTMAMSLLRHVTYTTTKTSQYDFRVDETMFSREIRNCTVGIIGTGKIGLTTAQLFKGLGAKVYGYDIYQSDAAKEVLEFADLAEVLALSDIITLHLPYFPGKNDQLVDSTFLEQMKEGAILINTARGELQDNQAVLEALLSGKLSGFGTDVFANESAFFFKNFETGDELPDQTVRQLVDLYPRVLVTPHIASNTDEALSNMIEQSYDNFNDVLQTGSSDNLVELPVSS